MTWWQRLLRRDRMERELHSELQSHLDALAADYVRAGLSDAEARRRARLDFGGLEGVTEECRDARGTRWVHDLARDLRFASRLLVRERGLTAAAVFALALGIGVNNTLFTILNAVCLRGLTIDGIERLVDLSNREARRRWLPITVAELEALRANVTAFEDVAAYTTISGTIRDADRAPERVRIAFVSANTARVLRETPRLGRDLRDEDDRPGAAAVVVLGDGLWRSRYAADPTIVGRTMLLNDRPATVVGVLPGRVGFPDNADLWQPLAARADAGTGATDRRLTAFARLRDGETIAGAGEQVHALSASLARLYPETAARPQLAAAPLNDRFKGRVTDPAWLAFITVGVLVVVIACSNVANLLLARAVRRAREIAIRLSLGATRARILRQLFAESLMLAGLGGLAGLALSIVGLRVFRNAIPPDGLPYWISVTMDARVIGTLGAVCLGATAIFGLAPAVHTIRTAVSDRLKEGSLSASHSVRARRWSAVFLTTQLAVAVILLSAMGLTVQSFLASRERQPIHTADVLTMWLSMPEDAYKTAGERQVFLERLHERLSGVPTVLSATAATVLPFSGADQRRVSTGGRAPGGADALPTVSMVDVGPGYFQTLGLPIVQGRAFTMTDGAAGSPSIIVNQRFAQMMFRGESALGRTIDLLTAAGTQVIRGGTNLRIVGIVPNVQQRPAPDPDPVVYRPIRAEVPPTIAVLLRGTGDAASLAATLRDEVRRLDPRIPLFRIMPLDRVNWEAHWNSRVSQGLIVTIALVGLTLAMFGLAALTAHNVAQRTREIGIRMALGAAPGEVMRLVLRRAGAQLAIGLAAGIAGAKVWERLFPSAGFGLAQLGTVAVFVTVVALAACMWPAWHAARLSPLDTLRHE